MNKLKAALFAAVMVVYIVFVGETLSSSDRSFSASAQTVAVKRKRKPGIARRSYHGGSWVVKKTWKTGRKVVSRTKKVVY